MEHRRFSADSRSAKTRRCARFVHGYWAYSVPTTRACFLVLLGLASSSCGEPQPCDTTPDLYRRLGRCVGVERFADDGTPLPEDEATFVCLSETPDMTEVCIHCLRDNHWPSQESSGYAYDYAACLSEEYWDLH